MTQSEGCFVPAIHGNEGPRPCGSFQHPHEVCCCKGNGACNGAPCIVGDCVARHKAWAAPARTNGPGGQCRWGPAGRFGVDRRGLAGTKGPTGRSGIHRWRRRVDGHVHVHVHVNLGLGLGPLHGPGLCLAPLHGLGLCLAPLLACLGGLACAPLLATGSGSGFVPWSRLPCTPLLAPGSRHGMQSPPHAAHHCGWRQREGRNVSLRALGATRSRHMWQGVYVTWA